MRVANRRRGLPESDYETALIGDLEILSIETSIPDGKTDTTARDPLSYEEAMSSTDADKWRTATMEEWGAVLANDTFQMFQDTETDTSTSQHLPLRAPEDVKIIGSKWVYKKKINPDGSTRYKVRLVIRGFEQVAGTDFGETYAPVSKLTTFRLLMSLAARNNWRVDHMDVVTAFLNPKIDREAVYMSLPPGISWIDPALHDDGVTVVRLKKALYGLRQAPKLWFDEINGFLLDLGFVASPADPNLYRKGSVILLLYVDDILVIDTMPGSQEGHRVKNLLSQRYKMTDLGVARRFRGIEINCTNQGISLGQTGYIDNVLIRFGLEKAHDAKSPMDPDIRLDNTTC